MVISVLVFFVISAFSSTYLVNGDAGNIWGYQDGIPPEGWPSIYTTCGGSHQSPIDIQTNQVVLDDRLPLFDLSDLDRINNIRMTIKNNGHTVEVDVEGQRNLFIEGGGLPGRYIVKQFHFHWGSADARGSEHDINGRPFPMEMHVVTYSDRFRMFEEAKNATGGLAVLAFLFDIGDENRAFDEIITHLTNIEHKDDFRDIRSFSLTSLFPPSLDVFYRYYGGLTTPPCYESVIWTIFQEHIRISERQINQFRYLGDRHINRFREISDNFRPPQPLNGRLVFTNDIRGAQYSRQSNLQNRIQPMPERGRRLMIFPSMPRLTQNVILPSTKFDQQEQNKNQQNGVSIRRYNMMNYVSPRGDVYYIHRNNVFSTALNRQGTYVPSKTRRSYYY